MMALYQAAGEELPGALATADRGSTGSPSELVERDDWTAVRSGSDLPVGGTALLTAGLVERRILTGDETHDELLRRLGRFLVAQTEPSGAVLASYELPADRAEPGVYSRYYTGEAYWALGRLHRVFPDEGWGETAGPGRRLHGRPPRRGRGLLAAAARSLGGLRPVRDRELPRTGRRAA